MINQWSQKMLQILSKCKNTCFSYGLKYASFGNNISHSKTSYSSDTVTDKINHSIYPSKKKEFFLINNEFDPGHDTFGNLLKNIQNVGSSVLYQDLFKYAYFPTFSAFSVENKSSNDETKEKISPEQKVKECNASDGYLTIMKQASASNELNTSVESYQDNQNNKSLLGETPFLDFNYPQMFISDILSIHTKDKVATDIESTENLNPDCRQQDFFDTIEKYVNYFKNSDSSRSLVENDDMLATDVNNANKSNITERPINRRQLPADISNNPLSILHIINSVDRSEAIIHKDLYITNKIIEEMEINKKKKTDDKINDSSKSKLEVKRMDSDDVKVAGNINIAEVPLDNQFAAMDLFDLKYVVIKE